ncbi:MAG: signal peptidase [Acidimicrobiaceae bacterium]|nr:signal peptidase [Acidimicrobiaceae bacterium]
METPPPDLPAVVEEPHNPTKVAVEWGAIIVAAIIAALIIKTFAFQAFYIPSESMDPTLKISDRVIVNKTSYKLHDIHRGDIVVFSRPPAELGGDPSIKDLIKRVVALPGEKVEGREGHVWVNDKMLDEPYLPKTISTLDFPAQVVPEKSYWVMGDNRPRSKDSRFFGPIGKNLVVGRAFIRVWPIPHVHLL